MPIYEYRCTDCGFQKEFLQRIGDAPLRDCPECGKPSFSKMVTAAGFQLKGSGWYVTDFRDKGGAKPAAAKEEAKVEAKTETKTAAKAEQPACGAGACPACN
jgi:putative FmdB family regulatory protein